MNRWKHLALTSKWSIVLYTWLTLLYRGVYLQALMCQFDPMQTITFRLSIFLWPIWVCSVHLNTVVFGLYPTTWAATLFELQTFLERHQSFHQQHFHFGIQWKKQSWEKLKEWRAGMWTSQANILSLWMDNMPNSGRILKILRNNAKKLF